MEIDRIMCFQLIRSEFQVDGSLFRLGPYGLSKKRQIQYIDIDKFRVFYGRNYRLDPNFTNKNIM